MKSLIGTISTIPSIYYYKNRMKLTLSALFICTYTWLNAATISSTATGGDWSDVTTWSGGVVPSSGDDVIIISGSVVVIRTPYGIGTGAACNSITIDGTLTIGSGSTAGRELDITTSLSIGSTGILNGGGNAFHRIYLGGDFTNNGSFAPTGNSGAIRIIFNGAGSQTISSTSNSFAFDTVTVTGAVGQNVTFGSNITSASVGMFRLSSGNFTAPSSFSCSNDFILTTGTYTAGANTSVQGNFTNDGATFNAGSGTVNFSGASQTIGGSAQTSFNNITTSGTSSTTISTSPIIGGDVMINDGTTLTITPNVQVDGKTTVGSGTSGALTLLTGSPKIFSGLVTINSGATWNNAANGNIHLEGGLSNFGTFTAGTGIYYFESNAQAVSGTISVTTADVTIALTNNGTFTVSSSLQNTGSLIQGTNAVLNIGGTSGITTLDASASGNTVNYNGSSQTIIGNNYVNLGLGGSGTKSLNTNTTSISGNLMLSGTASTTTVITLTIGGNLVIGDGTTFTLDGNDLTVTGTTTLGNGNSGSLIFSSAGGTKTFIGKVSIANGATWDNTIGKNVHFQNGIQNNGTLIAGSEIYFFDANNQSVSGTFSVGSINVTAGVTLTNSGTITVATDISANAIVQGLNSVLNIGGTSPINALDATTSANLINYTGASQFVKGFNYYNLTLSGSGSVTILSGLNSVSGNFVISGSVSASNPNAMTIGGNLTVGDGCSFNISGFDFTVSGKTTVGSGSSGLVTFTSPAGTKTFTGLVTVSTGGTWDNSSNNSDVTLLGGLTNSGAFTSGSGTYNFSTNAQNLTGNFTFGTINIIGITLTNKNSLIVNTSIAGTGTLAQASGATLTVNGISPLANISGNTTTNTVTYNSSSPVLIPGTYNNLILNQSSGNATLVSDIIFSGVLTLSAGNFDIGSNILNLGNTGTISISSPSASRMIIASGTGEVRKHLTAIGSFTFPVGDNIGSAEYSPITINVTSGSGFSSAYIGVSVGNSKQASNNSVTDYLTRYWNISQSGITGCLATITGTYLSTDITGTEANISSAQLNGTFNQTTNGWKIFSPLGSNTLSATGVTLTSGSVSVLTGIANLATTVSITGGGVIVCAGTPVQLGATTTGTPNFIYSWSPSTGLSSTTIANPLASINASATYTLTVYDGNGISAPDASTITILAAPNVTVNNPTICAGTIATLTASGALTYTWSSGLSSTSGTSVTGSPNSTTSYTLTGTDANNCTKSVAATITVNPVPAKPVITPSGLNTSTPTLTSSSSAGNQWFDNGTAVSGATNQTLSPSANGSYTVQVTSNGCTGPASDVYVLVITGIEGVNYDGVNLYPIPADRQLNIDWGAFSPNCSVEVRVYDLLGRMMINQTLTTNDKAMDIGGLATGQFIFQAVQGNQFNTQKFLKK